MSSKSAAARERDVRVRARREAFAQRSREYAERLVEMQRRVGELPLLMDRVQVEVG